MWFEWKFLQEKLFGKMGIIPCSGVEIRYRQLSRVTNWIIYLVAKFHKFSTKGKCLKVKRMSDPSDTNPRTKCLSVIGLFDPWTVTLWQSLFSAKKSNFEPHTLIIQISVNPPVPNFPHFLHLQPKREKIK